MCVKTMAYFMLLTILFASLYSIKGLQLCPNLWTVYHGSCYMLYQGSEEFITANHDCSYLHNSHLVTIESWGENKFLQDFLNNQEHRHSVWIGANDRTTAGDWQWISPQTNVSFSDWAPSQPDNNQGRANCVLMDVNNSFKWNNEPCTNQHDFICETR